MPGTTLPIILGSASPMRLKLLQESGFSIAEVITADIDEIEHKGEKPEQYCQRVTKNKFIAVANLIKQRSILITADTTAISRGIFLHKTYSDDEIKKYLKLLSGKKHKVITSVCCGIVEDGQIIELKSKTVISKVSVKKMHSSEILFFVNSQNGYGKAGGYTLQGIMSRYIKEIHGSYSSILGLPIYEVSQLLNSLEV
jgi:septum formation protein